MDDREVVAAIAAGDSAGIAAAYDAYAAGVYGYCHWMLSEPAGAAEAMLDTFVIAAARPGKLPEPAKLRPWLYAVARGECQRRLRATWAASDEDADAADGSAEVSIDPEQAELRTLVGAVLDGLKPGEREVIELSVRHHFGDDDLAVAFGVSSSRAHARAERAWDRLAKALGVLLIMRAGREACQTLNMLLADRDGQLTEQTRELVGQHIEQCQVCADRRRDALRPAVSSGLPPPPALPPGLREQALRLCSDARPDAGTYRRRVARREASLWQARFSPAIRLMSWESIRGNPGPAVATLAVLVWVVVAAGVTLLIFFASHPAHALTAQPTVSTSSASDPAASPSVSSTARVATRVSARATPSPTVSQTPIVLPPSVAPSTSLTSVSPTPSAKPSASPSPSSAPPTSPSSSPSPSPASPSPSSSPSKTGLGRIRVSGTGRAALVVLPAAATWGAIVVGWLLA